MSELHYSNMSKMEKEYATQLEKLAKSVKHPALKALLIGIAKDSEKHHKLYESIAQILEKPVTLGDEEYKVITEGLKKHIEMEKIMIEFIRYRIDEENDPRVKLLLTIIYEDEIRHHSILTTLREKLLEFKEYEEDKYWRELVSANPWVSETLERVSRYRLV